MHEIALLSEAALLRTGTVLGDAAWSHLQQPQSVTRSCFRGGLAEGSRRSTAGVLSSQSRLADPAPLDGFQGNRRCVMSPSSRS